MKEKLNKNWDDIYLKIRHKVNGTVYTVLEKTDTYWYCIRNDKPVKISINEIGWFQELIDIKL